MEDADHATHAIENERAGVPLGGEGAGLEVVVVDSEFRRLLAELIGEVGLEAGVAADGQVRGVAVLHNDEAGLAVAVEAVGIGQELARDPAVDTELAIGRELEHRLVDVGVRVELIGELAGRVLGPWR